MTHIYEKIEEPEVVEACKNLLKVCDPVSDADRNRIERAITVAYEAHKGMMRKAGGPYILHPIEVAQIVATEVGLGATSVICALLHDVVEDTDLTLEDLQREFGVKVADIVDGLTKIKVYNKSWVAQKAENFKKILFALGKDVRVILIKLADRLHNMRTMDAMPAKKQELIASETLFLYTPIAHRLGLYSIKSELEDLSIKYTQREVYKDIAKKLSQTKRSREKFIKEFIEPVNKKLKEGGIGEFQIYGRPKHIFSIMNKMKNKGVPFEEIYDLFAIRIIIDADDKEGKGLCWKAYSIVTDLYRPNPGRLRDWISNPKSNGYESLHTTVMSPGGKWVEVQIRTLVMNEIAEKGVAAHWKYKGGRAEGKFDDWLQKVREYLQNPQGTAVDLLHDFRHNLYVNNIYVFTPNGDVRTLPSGATILDFAFDIHTDLGCMCIGAKIDGKLYPISHKLGSGDQIEIITSKKQRPSEDWLNTTVTSKARTKIKQVLKGEKRKIAEMGKEILQRKLKNLIKTQMTNNLIDELAQHYKFNDRLEFLYQIAQKKFDLSQLKKLNIVGDKIVVAKENKPVPINVEEVNVPTKVADDVDINIFEGFADHIDYHIANCCKPVPGDMVFGFITVGKGISIHQQNCSNAQDLSSRYPYRIVKIKWAKATKNVMFLTHIRISGVDDIGLVNKLTSIISNDLKINMRSISLDATDGLFEGNIEIYLNDNKELMLLTRKLEEVEGIHKIERLS
ncbi:MAG: bifunctional (p)ppGpp synthetase/guanosine-3',5'-bis(diphosphate) 3'-pyrophosphohydrolase [Chitinophagales bacterium]